jgi:hypothetical protein
LTSLGISRSGKLRLTLRIDPLFENFTQWNDTPQAGMTTFLLSRAKAQHPSTVIRLLNFGEASGGGGDGLARVRMEPLAVVCNSSLSFTFAHTSVDQL